MMFAGYNTNGFAHHRLADAIEIIAELGYPGLALTPDVHHLDPTDEQSHPYDTNPVVEDIRRRRLSVVIETGARFILDSRKKHQPTLVSPTYEERHIRRGYLEECMTLAGVLGAECVSFWSGTPVDGADRHTVFLRLSDMCKRLADAGAAKGLRLAFEPEPGMFIDTMDKFAELHAKVNHPAFGLTIDIGHLVCNGELPVSRFLTDWKHVLWNVHIEDMRRGVHDHVMFGEGEGDFADVFAGLQAAGYAGGVYVELSRHSHDAVNTARKAKAFLGTYGL